MFCNEMLCSEKLICLEYPSTLFQFMSHKYPYFLLSNPHTLNYQHNMHFLEYLTSSDNQGSTIHLGPQRN